MELKYARSSRGAALVTLVVNEEIVEVHYDEHCEAEFTLDALESGRVVRLPRGASLFIQWLGEGASEPFDLRIDGDELFRTQAADEDPATNVGVAGIIVATLGGLQLTAGVLLRGGSVALITTGALLALIGVAILYTKSSKVILVGALIALLEIGVFLALSIGAGLPFPRLALLGAGTAAVALVMGHRGAKALEARNQGR